MDAAQRADYVATLKAEIARPEWHAGHPPEFNDLPPDWMWGTCFNDDCEIGIIELKDVGRWRRRSDLFMVTFSGICRDCLRRLA